MPFISNKERNKIKQKGNETIGFRKFLIFSVIIFSLITIIFLVLSIVATNGHLSQPDVSAFYDKLALFNSAGEFTTAGIVVAALIGADGLFSIVAAILILTIPSPKKVAGASKKLYTSPVGAHQKK